MFAANRKSSFKPILLLSALALILSAQPQNAYSAQKITAGATCSKINSKATYNKKIYTCIKKGKKLVWNSGVAINSTAPANKPSSSSTSNNAGTSSPSPTPAVQLPAEGSSCPKIGVKISTSFGYMRCNWPGGAISNGTWRSFTVKKISTSAANNYKITPVSLGSCENSGDTYDVKGGYLECRWTHGKKLKWIQINTEKQTFTNPVSPQSIETCRLKNADAVARTGRDEGSGKVGFPMDRTLKNGMNPKGTNEVLIVGVDFPELRGGNNLKSIISEESKWLKDWYRYFSNNQAVFNISSVDYWINSPRSAVSYVKSGNDGNSSSSNRFLADASQPFIDLITKEVDLRKFTTVYMIFPEGEITFDMDLIVRNERFSIKEGTTTLNFFGWGHDLELRESIKWVWFIHETIHDFDIIGHAPGNGWPFGMMQNDGGVSYAMNPYEQFLLDWLPVDQIYCQDFTNLTKSTVSLTPVEREDKQTKMAIIKISSTKAVVIESHGIDKWSSFDKGDRAFPPGFYSIVAYVVDLNKAGAPPVSADQRSLSNQDYAWAVFARVDGGKSTNYPYFPAAFGEDIYSATAVLGDTFTVEGVKIEFVATGDYETIEISKA